MDERKGGDSRYRSKLLVRQIDESEGMVIEARDIERNARSEAIGWLVS